MPLTLSLQGLYKEMFGKARDQTLSFRKAVADNLSVAPSFFSIRLWTCLYYILYLQTLQIQVLTKDLDSLSYLQHPNIQRRHLQS
jgi:hypothetical protein